MRVKVGVAGVVVGVGVMGAGVFAAFGTHTVSGVAVANRDQVVAVQGERAAADAKALADAAADLLSREEVSTRQSMQEYFDDPANGLADEGIVVSKVSLVLGPGLTFEGLATMSAGGGYSHDVKVHVTDDGRTSMWSTDEGGLLPLFR